MGEKSPPSPTRSCNIASWTWGAFFPHLSFICCWLCTEPSFCMCVCINKKGAKKGKTHEALPCTNMTQNHWRNWIQNHERKKRGDTSHTSSIAATTSREMSRTFFCHWGVKSSLTTKTTKWKATSMSGKETEISNYWEGHAQRILDPFFWDFQQTRKGWQPLKLFFCHQEG